VQISSNNLPGITLTAQSTPTNSEGTAIGGTGSTGYTATAHVELDSNGDVTASSEATLNDLALGQLVTVSDIDSTASEIFDNSTGKLTHTSSLSIGDISVPGLKIAIPKTTPTQVPVLGKLPGIPLPFGGTTIAAPQLGFVDGTFTVSLPFLGGATYALPFGVVAAALKAAGITATFEQPIVDGQSVVSSALVLKDTLPSLPKNLPITGPVPVTLTLGRATASFSGKPLVGEVPPAVSGATTPVGADTSPVGTASAPVTSLPGLGGEPGAVSAGEPPAQPPQVAGSTYLTARGLDLPDTSGIYLIIVGTAILGTIAAQALRVLGVKIRWNS
jgi:hypothetical protein